MILGLIHNIALLLAISMLTDFFWKNEEISRKVPYQILTGVILGLIVIVIMLTPWIFIPGVVFDTRSVLLSISGLFFGWIPTLIAALFAITFRIITGGDGTTMGVAVIVFSAVIGILWRLIKLDFIKKRNILEIYLLGLVVHVVMVGCVVFLPASRQINVLKTIAYPVLLFYPVFTLMFGLVIRSRKKIWITKRALRESDEMFRMFFENSSTPTAIIEDDTTISMVNEAFCQMIGFSKEEIRNTSWMQQVVPEDLDKLLTYNKLRAAGEQNVPLKYEFSYFKKSGERRQTKILISYLSEFNKKIASFIDLTEIKRVENQLIRAKESAEQNDRLKSAFLASMSHELRTPLNSIIGFSDMLMSDNVKMDTKQFAKIINENGVQLLTLIESIFELALLQSREVRLEISCFSCDELFKGLGQSLVVEKSVKLKDHLQTEYLPDPRFPGIRINSDKFRINQLIINLLNNAVKYTEQGKIEYGYRVNGKDIVFFVRDTGIGIPAEKHTVIFEKFRQADDSHTRLHGGVGLGLSICKEIEIILNGKLWVESVVGTGSSFYFELKNVVAENSESIKLTNWKMAIPDFSGKTILIVDDLEDNIFLLRKILESTGAKTLSAKSGAAAIQLISDRPEINLVLMDVKMPGMDGFVATAEIHKLRPDIPVVAQTAYAMKDDQQNAFNLGCVGYVSKPIIREELYGILASLMF